MTSRSRRVTKKREDHNGRATLVLEDGCDAEDRDEALRQSAPGSRKFAFAEFRAMVKESEYGTFYEDCVRRVNWFDTCVSLVHLAVPIMPSLIHHLLPWTRATWYGRFAGRRANVMLIACAVVLWLGCLAAYISVYEFLADRASLGPNTIVASIAIYAVPIAIAICISLTVAIIISPPKLAHFNPFTFLTPVTLQRYNAPVYKMRSVRDWIQCNDSESAALAFQRRLNFFVVMSMFVAFALSVVTGFYFHSEVSPCLSGNLSWQYGFMEPLQPNAVCYDVYVPQQLCWERDDETRNDPVTPALSLFHMVNFKCSDSCGSHAQGLSRELSRGRVVFDRFL
jgi:hypothetical protein